MKNYFIAFLFYALNCSFAHAAVLKVTNVTNYPLVVQRRSSKEKDKFRIEEQKMIGPMSTVKLDSGAHEIKLLTFLAPKEQAVNFIKQFAESNKNLNAKELTSKIEGQKLLLSSSIIQQQLAMPETWTEVAVFNPKIKSIDTQSEVIFGAPDRIFLNTPKALVIFEIILITAASVIALYALISGAVVLAGAISEYMGPALVSPSAGITEEVAATLARQSASTAVTTAVPAVTTTAPTVTTPAIAATQAELESLIASGTRNITFFMVTPKSINL